jgi:uncharacterized membrane protein
MVYCIAIIFSAIMAVSRTVFLIYVGRVKEYILERKRQNNGLLIRAKDATWKVLLPIVIGITAFLLPLFVIQWCAENTTTIPDTCTIFATYLCSFVIWFIISMVVAARRGTFKVSDAWPSE